MRILILLMLFACMPAWPADNAGVSLLDEPLFPKPSYFRKRFFTPPPRIELQPPSRFDDYVQDGKLVLSLKNYLGLVAQNNTDITIQKVNVEFSRNQITRAYSIFDPFASASFSSTRTESPSGTALAGATSLNTLVQPLNAQVQQTIATGGQYSVAFNAQKISTNSTFAFYNPEIDTSLNLAFSQPLLRGRGPSIVKLPIMIARGKLAAARFNLRDQVTQLVTFAENAYWDVVGARENLRVQEEALKLADAALQRARKEVELGATSPLEIYQPEANYATAQVAVTQARFRLAETEDALRKQMGADLDSRIRALPLVLTESAAPPDGGLELNSEEEVNKALRFRPDLNVVVQNLDVDEKNIKLARNNLLPNLSLGVQYSSNGLGGIFFPGVNLTNGLELPPVPGGLLDSLSQVFRSSNPSYGFSLNLRFPLRDRNAAANLADSAAQKRLDMLQKRTLEQSLRLQVLNAVHEVQNSRESVKLARTARDLAQKRVEADQKRYELGTTTLFFVLASQNDFTVAESNLVTQSINYRRNLLQLLQRTGELLDDRGIVLQ
ncbi:MAG TPA: TolC family protein [Bryobacteraceae bacterium]|jgi:outer membrane protein TolC|nr:TolC family protein [Bryobacteraceae bacterium]